MAAKATRRAKTAINIAMPTMGFWAIACIVTLNHENVSSFILSHLFHRLGTVDSTDVFAERLNAL